MILGGKKTSVDTQIVLPFLGPRIPVFSPHFGPPISPSAAFKVFF
jgi:hypothetical protein